MSNCKYCSGDREDWISYLPKIGRGRGNAVVYKSIWGSKLIVSLPFREKLEYQIHYCPMCGEKLNNPRKL